MKKNHGNKEQQQGGPLVSLCSKAGTHRDVSRCFPCRILASLGQVGCDRPGPPACGKWVKRWKVPFVQGWTHTHTHGRGGFKDEGWGGVGGMGWGGRGTRAYRKTYSYTTPVFSILKKRLKDKGWGGVWGVVGCS